MRQMNSTTKKQAIYDSYGCTEEDLAYLFPKGTKVQLAFRNYSGYKTCSIFIENITSEEYRRRSQELVREHNLNGGGGVGRLYHSWRSMACGPLKLK